MSVRRVGRPSVAVAPPAAVVVPVVVPPVVPRPPPRGRWLVVRQLVVVVPLVPVPVAAPAALLAVPGPLVPQGVDESCVDVGQPEGVVGDLLRPDGRGRRDD